VSHYGTFIEGWESVNSVDPKSLGEARLTAHWAAQIIGGVGDALVPAEPDFSHTGMEWSNELRALVGGATPAGSRVSLRPEDLTIRVHSPDGTATAIELEGKTSTSRPSSRSTRRAATRSRHARSGSASRPETRATPSPTSTSIPGHTRKAEKVIRRSRAAGNGTPRAGSAPCFRQARSKVSGKSRPARFFRSRSPQWLRTATSSKHSDRRVGRVPSCDMMAAHATSRPRRVVATILVRRGH
jgi:hypothetical protein